MRQAPARRMLEAVSDDVLHIAINVSVAEDQIQGHIGDGVQQPRTFLGWLGLIGELDRMLDSPRRPATPGSSSRDRVTSEENRGER